MRTKDRNNNILGYFSPGYDVHTRPGSCNGTLDKPRGDVLGPETFCKPTPTTSNGSDAVEILLARPYGSQGSEFLISDEPPRVPILGWAQQLVPLKDYPLSETFDHIYVSNSQLKFGATVKLFTGEEIDADPRYDQYSEPYVPDPKSPRTPPPKISELRKAKRTTPLENGSKILIVYACAVLPADPPRYTIPVLVCINSNGELAVPGGTAHIEDYFKAVDFSLLAKLPVRATLGNLDALNSRKRNALKNCREPSTASVLPTGEVINYTSNIGFLGKFKDKIDVIDLSALKLKGTTVYMGFVELDVNENTCMLSENGLRLGVLNRFP